MHCCNPEIVCMSFVCICEYLYVRGRGLLMTRDFLKVRALHILKMVWRSSRSRNLLNSNSTGGQLITGYAYTSSEHESSEGEFVEPEKPWPPAVDLDRASRSRTKVAALNVPRPQSHLFRKSDGRARGSKHSRRWENCKPVF